jgi:hypothetical protein
MFGKVHNAEKGIPRHKKTQSVKNASLRLSLSLLALTLGPSIGSAFAADTDVTCADPQLQINTGRDGSAPRTTIFCAKGSSASGILWFAWRDSDNPTVAQLIAQDYQAYFQAAATQGCHLHISTNLSDTSGWTWGCGAANCRIIDFISCAFP